jgi:hypothetical protein
MREVADRIRLVVIRLCFLCGRQIGFLRSLTDEHYCSIAHRRDANLASAKARRDEEEFEPWSVAKVSKEKKLGPRGASDGKVVSVLAVSSVASLLLATWLLPGQATGDPSPSVDNTLQPGLLEEIGGAMGALIRGSSPATLHHDFHSGLAEWTSVGKLRLWDRSRLLQNYQMEFLGQIEKRSLSWAFRMTDQNNYYATKLVMSKTGRVPSALLVQYIVMNGKELERQQSVLPRPLERGVNYRVRVSVEDDNFITYLNGEFIGKWTDKRLPRGGIGFFDDAKDPQQVAWVDLSERDTFLGRMLAHFSLFVVPGTSLLLP